ncbi:cytochrome b [Acetobacter fallax]|uniref:Cytochrome b n=1 Tax=Acetobacter fallax TaxID=1737473 RepID=A0ABX0K8B0_9PROT|nr:cytochrome b/b6 domain-containing protein [Acetobacter fallax]NHO32649.1 cytochrome b [Acetobacter fallax]NHO36153.1 cytochrome b [Acetobacter fallax]
MSTSIRFSGLARILHWLMAVMILTMLFVGVFMATTTGPAYYTLLSLHRPLGIAILLLALVRLTNRLLVPPPSLPDTMPPLQKAAALGSHVLLYALMIAMPLIGWGMLSAGNYPVIMWGGFHLPPILPHNPVLFATLRHLHTWLAILLFATILLHLAAALLHALILRDSVWPSMVSFRRTERDLP